MFLILTLLLLQTSNSNHLWKHICEGSENLNLKLENSAIVKNSRQHSRNIWIWNQKILKSENLNLTIFPLSVGRNCILEFIREISTRSNQLNVSLYCTEDMPGQTERYAHCNSMSAFIDHNGFNRSYAPSIDGTA